MFHGDQEFGTMAGPDWHASLAHLPCMDKIDAYVDIVDGNDAATRNGEKGLKKLSMAKCRKIRFMS